MGLIATLRHRLTGRAAAVAEARILRESGLVDADHYRRAYGEGDAVADYLRHGVARRRNPNPFFDTAWYLDRYPDVREAGLNPLLHFIAAGAAEGRDPGPGFDTTFYLAADPGIATAGMNPLGHYIRHGRAEGRPPRPPARIPLDLYEAALTRRRSVVGSGEIEDVHFPLHPPTGERDDAGRPLPPLRLAQRIGALTLSDFDFVGRETKRTILRCLPPDFRFEGARVLDFGCGVGRVLRHFSEEASQGEIWGCDIDGPSIRWAVENLAPPFRLFQLSEIPTLPLESDSFDLVYAISVFAHIHADWHHWLAEVRRILKPGGHAFITFMAQTPFEEMLGRSFWDQGPEFGKYVVHPFSDWNEGGPMAFHNPDWIRTYWGNLFDIEFLSLDGLLEYQSICFMRKPARGCASRRDVPVLRHSTVQAFDRDAVGRIAERPDPSRPYLESYGVEAQGETRISGWIAFRGDRPATLELRIDGAARPARVEFAPGAPYRDWERTVQTTFAAETDVSGMASGEHRLEIRIGSAGGKVHVLAIPLLVR